MLRMASIGHYTYIAPEYGSNTNHTGYLWTIDTTDPAQPFLVSKWKLPNRPFQTVSHPHHYIPGGYIFSPHNGDTGLWARLLDPLPCWSLITDRGHIWDELVWENGVQSQSRFQAISVGTIAHLGILLPEAHIGSKTATELGYDMADCWASCMIPFDWGLQYDPRGFVFISEMVSGVYVVQFDEDHDARYDYPPLWTAEASDQ